MHRELLILFECALTFLEANNSTELVWNATGTTTPSALKSAGVADALQELRNYEEKLSDGWKSLIPSDKLTAIAPKLTISDPEVILLLILTTFLFFALSAYFIVRLWTRITSAPPAYTTSEYDLLLQ